MQVLQEIRIDFHRVGSARSRPPASAISAPQKRRRRTRRRIVPEPASLKDLANHLILPRLNKGDNPHPAATLGAYQRIDMVDTPDQRRPTRTPDPRFELDIYINMS